MLPSPFQGLGQEEIIQAAKAYGEKSEAEFDSRLNELEAAILTIDPLVMLASLSFYGLTSPGGENREFQQADPLLPHQVELIQALVLRHALDDFSSGNYIPNEAGRVVELSQQAGHLFTAKRLASIDPASTDEERRRLAVQESVRIDTQIIRNWGYPQQITDVCTRLFLTLDDSIYAETGLRIGALIEMFHQLLRNVEDRLNDHFVRLRPTFKARSVAAAIRRYADAFPDTRDDARAVLQEMKDRNATRRDVKLILATYGDFLLPDMYTLTIDTAINAYPGNVDPAVLGQLLDNLSLGFGDLSGRDAEYFFLDNPVWTRPLIRLGDGRFFWPIPGLFFSFCMELMEAIIEPYPVLVELYERRRAEFLELEVERLFKSAFPQAHVHRGLTWKEPRTGEIFETDLLVLIDNHAIVVEAKSGKVTPPARRGAPSRLKKTIEELLVAPSVQAYRFVDYLTESKGTLEFPGRNGEIRKVDTSRLVEVVPLSVLLRPIASLEVSWPELRDAGFIPPDTRMAPAVTIVDLEIILEILQGECQTLHYLTRRAEFERNATYVADELDLLGFYLETGFNIGEREFDGSRLILVGESQMFDAYYMRNRTGERAEKPAVRLSPWWRDILRQVELKRSGPWIQIGHLLLNVGYEDQVKFERTFNQAQSNVRRHPGRSQDKDVAILLNGPSQRREGLVGVTFRGLDTNERRERAFRAGGLALDADGISRCLIIGQDVDHGIYPYGLLAAMAAKDDPWSAVVTSPV